MSRQINGIKVVYDGECPFCSRYAQMLRLREAVGRVDLVDARSAPELVERYELAGYTLDEGMIVEFGDRPYHGADAMHLLGLLSAGGNPVNRGFAALMRNPERAKLLYPVFRAVRNTVLRALGRKKLNGHPF